MICISRLARERACSIPLFGGHGKLRLVRDLASSVPKSPLCFTTLAFEFVHNIYLVRLK